MNTTLIISLVLGIGGGMSGIYAFINQIRDRRANIRKQEGEIILTEEQRNKIAAEAAQINSLAAIAQQDWWKRQFEEVKEQLKSERRYRRSIMRYIQEIEAILMDRNIPLPPRPVLDLEDT